MTRRAEWAVGCRYLAVVWKILDPFFEGLRVSASPSRVSYGKVVAAVLLLIVAAAYPLARRMVLERWEADLPRLSEWIGHSEAIPGRVGDDMQGPPEADADGVSSTASEAGHVADDGGGAHHAQPSILERIGEDTYALPSGLKFTRGSAEGHRLKHLERHLQDHPSRPGPHGVFLGDLEHALQCIDEAYRLAMEGDDRAQVRQQQDRTVIEVAFPQPIGYVGGSEGERRGHPPARRLRLIVQGDRFITGFPY